MSVTLWHCDVSKLNDPALFKRGMQLLPWPERREKIGSLRFDEDKCLSLGAGLLTAHALRQAGALDLTLSRGPVGKPFLSHYPDLHFNISHSGTMAVCAVAGAPVGVDVEKHRAARNNIAAHCFHPLEVEWLAGSQDPDRDFTRLWTRKESFIKMTGRGITQPLNEFTALPGENGEGRIRLTDQAEATGGAYCLTTALDAHTISLCVPDKDDIRIADGLDIIYCIFDQNAL